MIFVKRWCLKICESLRCILAIIQNTVTTIERNTAKLPHHNSQIKASFRKPTTKKAIRPIYPGKEGLLKASIERNREPKKGTGFRLPVHRIGFQRTMIDRSRGKIGRLQWNIILLAAILIVFKSYSVQPVCRRVRFGPLRSLASSSEISAINPSHLVVLESNRSTSSLIAHKGN